MWNEFKIIYKNNLLLQIFWESNIMYEKNLKIMILSYLILL